MKFHLKEIKFFRVQHTLNFNPPLSYSGACIICDINHSLPSSPAIVHCLALMDNLRTHGRIDWDIPIENANPQLNTGFMYSEMRGKMLGVLVCENAFGEEVILRAFSSKFNGVLNVPGWAPPMMDEEKFNATMATGNLAIHPLTDRIQNLDKGSKEWILKVAERKAVSRGVLAKLEALYEVENFKHEKRTLADAYNNQRRMPVGTGDCCAPKLLNYAARNNLKPIGLAEFFWGKETASGGRVEGEFYSSCVDKCQPLLGFMLCGL